MLQESSTVHCYLESRSRHTAVSDDEGSVASSIIEENPVANQGKPAKVAPKAHSPAKLEPVEAAEDENAKDDEDDDDDEIGEGE